MADWYRDHPLSPECYPDEVYFDWAQDNGLYADAAGNVDYGPPLADDPRDEPWVQAYLDGPRSAPKEGRPVTALNATAKATLKAAGVSQAEWARANYMESGKWSGDACGCPDDRCANGFHHMGEDDCGCLPTLLAEYLHPEGWHTFPVTRAEELSRRRGARR